MSTSMKIILFLFSSVAIVCSQTFAACELYFGYQERMHGIPKDLLAAVSLVESGRRSGRIMAPWPWVINAEGKSFYFSSKMEAIQAVQNLKVRGIQSIDVGCMQINLKQHPHAFKNLDEAFSPQSNTAYAAHFLHTLKNKLGSWQKAVQYYHSATPKRHVPYQQRVWNYWQKLKSNQIQLSTDGIEYTKYQLGDFSKPSSRFRFSPYARSPRSNNTDRKLTPPASGFFNISGGRVRMKASYKITRLAIPTEQSTASIKPLKFFRVR